MASTPRRLGPLAVRRRLTHPSRKTSRRRRGLVAALTGTLVLGAAASALAVPVAPQNPDGTLKVREGQLTEVGPIADNGFPLWYRDSNGVRLEACTTLDDPLCAVLPDELPDPNAPVSYPDNFPGEFFYQLAGAELTGNGLDMTLAMDLEGAWATETVVEGDQMVFGRIRIRDKSIANGEYRVTHPYGVDEFVAEGGEGINYTQDIGAAPGAFGQALASRVGPFLKWDPAVAPAAPEGYVGDPGIDHPVVGSPYGTNFVSVERKNADGTWTQLARTDLFSIQGRHATNSGLDVEQATYSVGADGAGFVDVYARSDAGQSLHVMDSGLGFVETPLEGDDRHYYGRFAIEDSPDGKSVTVANVGDKPVAQKEIELTDVVTVTQATYDADADTLTVAASSSDQDSTPGQLSVEGQPLVDGTVQISTVAPTATVTVTSDKGGSATVPVVASGAGMEAPVPVAAAFASPVDAAPNQKVTLTGTGSTGTIDTYAWRQVPATNDAGDEVPVDDTNRVTLTGADTPVATFNAPAGYDGLLAFELVVSGPSGTSVPTVVTVGVTPFDPNEPTPVPTADAGADQTVRRGTTVNLDASASKLADDYAWTQVSGPAVELTGANTATPSFRFPVMPLPTNTTGPNTDYTTDERPVVLKLTVTGQGGQQATDEITVNPAPENLRINLAEYRAGTGWRVTGTSDILAGQRVAVVIGPNLTQRVMGYTTVDATGAWDFRGALNIQPGSRTRVSAASEMGGSHLRFAFTVR